MHIEIRYSGTDRSESLDNAVRQRVTHENARFADRLTRIEVHVEDANAGKAGPQDKGVMLEARPRGQDPIVVRDRGSDLYEVVREASRKLSRALERHFERGDRGGV